MKKIKITDRALEKMKKADKPYTLYLSCRGG